MGTGDDAEPPPAGRRVTRRHVLVAGTVAAVGVAAAGGWAVVDTVPSVRRRLHAAGLLDGPDHAVPQVEGIPAVAYGVLDAPDGRRYRWGRWTPAGGEPELRLVCLHPRGGDEAYPFRTLGVHRFVANAGLPWTVASLAGGDDYWHPRADGADPLGALTDGLLPMLAPRGGPLAVLGWSMGGYGALLLAERPPVGLVAAVASSPAVWASFGGAAAGAFDDAADFRAHDVLAGADALRGGPSVRVDCGEDDVFAGTSRRLLEAVPGAAGGIHPGFHDEGTWRSFLPAQIGWIGSGR